MQRRTRNSKVVQLSQIRRYRPLTFVATHSMTPGKGIADMHRREAECSLDSGYILSLNIRLGW